MCDARKLPIGPLFEKIALSKFILTVTGHKLSLSEGLAGPQVFFSYQPKQGRYFFTFENGFAPAWGYNKFCMVPKCIQTRKKPIWYFFYKITMNKNPIEPSKRFGVKISC